MWGKFPRISEQAVNDSAVLVSYCITMVFIVYWLTVLMIAISCLADCYSLISKHSERVNTQQLAYEPQSTTYIYFWQLSRERQNSMFNSCSTHILHAHTCQFIMLCGTRQSLSWQQNGGIVVVDLVCEWGLDIIITCYWTN